MINVDKVDKKTIEAAKQGFAYRVMNLEEVVGSLKDGAGSVFCYIVYALKEKQYMSAKSFSKIFPAQLESLSRVRYLKPADFKDIDITSIIDCCYETAKDKLHIIAALVFEGRDMYQIINFFSTDEYRPPVAAKSGPLTERKVRVALNNESQTSFDTIIQLLSLEQKKEFARTMFELHICREDYIEERAFDKQFSSQIALFHNSRIYNSSFNENDIAFICSQHAVLKIAESREIAILIYNGYSSEDIFDFYINLKGPVGTSKPKAKKKSKLPLNRENIDFILKNSEIASKSMEEIIRAVKYSTIAPCPLKIIYKLQVDRKKVLKRDTFKYLFHSQEQVIKDRINSLKIGERQELIKNSDFPIDQLSENLKIFDNIELALIREILMVCYQGYTEKEVLTYYKGCLKYLEPESLPESLVQPKPINKQIVNNIVERSSHSNYHLTQLIYCFLNVKQDIIDDFCIILFMLQLQGKNVFIADEFQRNFQKEIKIFYKEIEPESTENDLTKKLDIMLKISYESSKRKFREILLLLYDNSYSKQEVYEYYKKHWEDS